MTGYTAAWKLPYPDNMSAAADSPAAFKALADSTETALTKAAVLPAPQSKEAGNAPQTIVKTASSPLPSPVTVTVTAPAAGPALLVLVSSSLFMDVAGSTTGNHTVAIVSGATSFGSADGSMFQGDTYRSASAQLLAKVPAGTAATFQVLAHKSGTGAVTVNYVKLRATPLGYLA